MSIAYDIFVAICIIFAIVLMRNLINESRLKKQFKVLTFLTIQSQEHEDSYVVNFPKPAIHMRKTLQLTCTPQLGAELDGIGTKPIKIIRIQLQEKAIFDAFLYLEPLNIPLLDLESYSKTMADDCGWEILGFDPR